MTSTLLIVLLLGCQTEGCAAGTTVTASSFPAPQNIVRPVPEPALPVEFDVFTPPIVEDAATATSTAAPAVAEWTRTGGPDETIVVSGHQFSSYADANAGKDTRFVVYGQSSNGQASFKDGKIMRLDQAQAAFILRRSLPPWSMYLIWPKNAAGLGRPVAVNQTEAWWIGPHRAARGDTVSVFGRNLSHDNGTNLSWVYLKAGGEVLGTWLQATAVNPYKIDFVIPPHLANGSYEVWAHNGHGGRYGWSGPHKIDVAEGAAWSGAEINVKQFGAKGDGAADDEAAIQAALNAAQQRAHSTVYFPAGTYSVSRGFRLPANVRWRGDGKDLTLIQLNRNFVKPAAYDDRRYCLIFDSSASTRNIELKDLTLDADHHLGGYLDTLIHLRGPSEIRLTNVRVKAEGYKFFDLHLSSLIFLKNCDFIGTGGFLGNARQVFVDGCNFFGTHDANTLLDSWGADGLSVTNSSARDFDNSTATGWAQGRFVYGNAVWGSNRHIYAAHNKTFDLGVRPDFNNQTSGEQFLWEGNSTHYTGRPTSASAHTVAFENLIGPYGDGRYEAVIVKGKGLGQHRRITKLDAATRTITISPAWNLIPDSGSTIIVAAVAEKIVLYRNSIDGKSDYATRETASSGVQPYGNSYDFIADGNAINQVLTGISSWATDEKNTWQPCYFNLYANNKIQNARTGALANVEYAQGSSDDAGVSYFGNSFRRNTLRRLTRGGFVLAGAGAPPNRQLEMTVIEHNVGADLPVAINSSVRPGDDRTIGNTIVFMNNFNRGQAPSANSAGVRFSSPGNLFALRDNVWSNFANQYAGTSPGAYLEAPYHALEISVTAGGTPAETTLLLRNTGTASLNWSAAADAAWLKLSPSTGVIPDERFGQDVTLRVDPKSLTPGNRTATISVNDGRRQTRYTLSVIVRPPVSAR